MEVLEKTDEILETDEELLITLTEAELRSRARLLLDLNRQERTPNPRADIEKARLLGFLGIPHEVAAELGLADLSQRKPATRVA